MDKVSKSVANYRTTPSDNTRCGTCSMFRQPQSCTAVEGPIRAIDVCDLYRKKAS